MQREVPWRQGNDTRSATRGDLLRILLPVSRAPDCELLAANVTYWVEGGRSRWSATLHIYVTPRTRDPVVIPHRKCAGRVLDKTTRWRSERLILTTCKLTLPPPSLASSPGFGYTREVLDRMIKEAEAARSLVKLLEAAMECRRVHEEAGLSLPEPLLRLLGQGDGGHGAAKGHARMTIPPPPRPPAPPGTGPDWIWVEASKMKATNLVLAVLHGASAPMRAGDLLEAVKRLDPEVSAGTIANIGTRLAGKSIARGPDGWTLIPGVEAAVLHGQYVWGPVSLFEMPEVAAYRRMGILHILKSQPDGLQIVQITKAWNESCPWRGSPDVTKDLVKIDLQVLAQDKLARRMAGNAGKWTAVSDEPTKERRKVSV